MSPRTRTLSIRSMRSLCTLSIETRDSDSLDSGLSRREIPPIEKKRSLYILSIKKGDSFSLEKKSRSIISIVGRDPSLISLSRREIPSLWRGLSLFFL